MTALINAVEDEHDRGLVARHQAGDPAAFGELYARHYARLYRFCRRLVRDPHVAEEVAQDAFLRAYLALDRFEGDRRVYPWLTVIARRLVIDHVRRSGRVEPRATVDAGHFRAAEDEVVQRLDGDEVLAALDRVRERHREIIRLRDWEGLSYEAIAERLNLAPTAIPPLLHRARAALRREYLLVTEGRVAAVLPLGLLGLFRRVRDRLAGWASLLPDANVLSAPVAGAVLGLSAFLGLPFTGAAPHAAMTPASITHPGSSGDPADAAGTAADGRGTGDHAQQLTGADGPGQSASEEVVVPDVASLSIDTRPGATGRRPHDKDKPIFVEVGPIGYAGDPENTGAHFTRVVEKRLP